MNRHDERLDNPESDELLEHYDFDYRKAKPNRFAAHLDEEQLMVVVDADLAVIFPTSEAVNEALRVLASAAEKLPGVAGRERA